MAAIGRLSRLAVTLLPKSKHLCCLCRKHAHFNAQLTRQLNGITYGSGFNKYGRFLYTTSVFSDYLKPSNTSNTSRNNLTATLERMQTQKTSYGHIDIHQIRHCLKLLRNGATFTRQQAVELIQSTGSLVKLPEEERQTLHQTAWKVLRDRGFEVDIDCYNAALKSRIENNDVLNPADVIPDLESRGLKPNVETYDLLVECYCSKGDLPGARNILEMLKVQGLSKSRTVYHALIRGHMNNSDIDLAKSTVEQMSNAGLVPSTDTRTVLMCGYAKQGNLDAIRQMVTDAEKDQSELEVSQLFEVVYSLATTGHEDHIQEILCAVKERRVRYNREAQLCMRSLLAVGALQQAYQLFMFLDRTSPTNHMGGRMFLRALVQAGQSADEFVFYSNKLYEAGLLEEDLSFSAEWCAQIASKEFCLDLFQKMLGEGFSLRPQHFWPLFRNSVTEADIDGMYSLLNAVFNPGADVNMFLGTIFEEGIMGLLELGESEKTIIKRLEECGCPENKLDMIQVLISITQGRYAEALEILKTGVEVAPNLLSSAVPSGFYLSSYDVNGLTEILHVSVLNYGRNFVTANSRILRNIVRQYGQTSQHREAVESLIDSYVDKRIHILPSYKEEIIKLLKQNGMSWEVVRKVMEMPTSHDKQVSNGEGYSSMYDTLQSPRQRSINQLLDTRRKLESYQTSTTGIDEALLHKYCTLGDSVNASKMKESLDAAGYVYGPNLLRQLALLACKEKDLPTALRYKNRLELENPHFVNHSHLILNLATVQVELGLPEDALRTIKDYVNHPLLRMMPDSIPQTYHNMTLCRQLLEQSLVHSPPEVTRRLVDRLCDGGLVTEGSDGQLSGYIVRAHLDRSDLDGAMRALEYCLTKYKTAPRHREIINYFIKNADSQRLQKVVDLLSVHRGDTKVTIGLIFRFIESGMTKEARRILKTHGLYDCMAAVKEECQYFVEMKKADEMKKVVEETKGVNTIDQEEMLFQLIKTYAASGEPDLALDVLSMFEEIDMSPRYRTLHFLAKHQEDHGRPVPFNLPVVPRRTASRHKDTRTTRRLPGDVQAMATQLDRCSSLNHEVPKQTMYDLKNYSIEDLKQLKRSLSPTSLSNRKIYNIINRCTFKAHILSHQTHSILEYFKDNPEVIESHINFENVNLLAEKNMDLLPKFEELCTTHSQLYALQCLISIKLLQLKFKEAKQMSQEVFPVLNKDSFLHVSRIARKNHREEVLRGVLTHFPECSADVLLPVYNEAIHLKCMEGSWQEALDYYNEALDKGINHKQIPTYIVHKLEHILRINGQSLPWASNVQINST